MFSNKHLTKNNPFSKLDIENFLPEATVNNPNKSRYEQSLVDLARLFISLKTVPDDFPDANFIHPFIEQSGALRVEVPLPQSGRDLIILVTIILGNITKNEQNADQYKILNPNFQSDGVLAEGFPAKRVDLRYDDYQKKKTDRKRSLLLWEDAANISGTTKDNRNLYLLICSILFQQADISAYGHRGRYGKKVLHRLLDGRAIGKEGDLYNPMMSVFWVDAEMGMPYGFYNTALYQKYNTVFLNYTFIVDYDKIQLTDSNGDALEDQKVKATTLSIAIAMAHYNKKFDLDCGSSKLIIHTDKALALLSTKSHLTEIKLGPEEKGHDEQVLDPIEIAHYCYGQIDPQDEASFFKEFRVAGYPTVVAADQSTVPPNDPGEEVPNPSYSFYRNAYASYAKMIEQETQNKMPEMLINGTLTIGDLKEIGIFSNRSPAAIEAWLHNPAALSYIFRSPDLIEGRTCPAIEGKHIVSSNFKLNHFDGWEALDKNIAKQCLDIRGDAAIKEIVHKAGRVLTRAAKRGNTGNSVHGPIGRLTAFGFFMIGDVKQGGELASALTTAAYYVDLANQ
jgi:hypothetical protein